jgi:hypothetical protein
MHPLPNLFCAIQFHWLKKIQLKCFPLDLCRHQKLLKAQSGVGVGALWVEQTSLMTLKLSTDHAVAHGTHTHTHTHKAPVSSPLSQFSLTHNDAVYSIHPSILNILTRPGERSASRSGRFAARQTASVTLMRRVEERHLLPLPGTEG